MKIYYKRRCKNNICRIRCAMEKRNLCLNRLIRREKNGLIKVVTGVRRCGKSYLLFNLFHDYLIDKGAADDYSAVALSPKKRKTRESEKGCPVRVV